MASYTLSGSGTQALSGNVTAVHVTINTPAASSGLGRANPASHYDVGLLRFGDGTGWWAPVPINGGPQWIGVPAGATVLGYSVFGAVSITVAEVIGGSPPFGTSSLSLEQLTDVSVASVANGQVVTWDSALGKWKNAAVSGGGGIGAPVLQLNYRPTLAINAVNLSANTWTDVHANQSFTVDLATSLVVIAVGGTLQFNGSGNVSTRFIVDSAGTPVIRNIGGSGTAAGINALQGAQPTVLSGLAAGSHTVKTQINAHVGGPYYCDTVSQPDTWFFYLQVLELKTA